jgi:hypothetical protein
METRIGVAELWRLLQILASYHCKLPKFSFSTPSAARFSNPPREWPYDRQADDFEEQRNLDFVVLG